MLYDEGDEQDIVRKRKRRGVAPSDDVMEDALEDDTPIDILENMRGRTPRDHVSDEAVGREIERRYLFRKKVTH